MSKILVVDDEKAIVKGLSFGLMADGYEVDAAYDGLEAVDLVRNNNYDMVLLDVMLPELDGMEVCRTVREFSDVPIIMLTAKGDDLDKIKGLNIGADDYMTKPFNILEVKARINAITRRNSRMNSDNKKDLHGNLVVGSLNLDKNRRRVTIEGREIILTIKEYDVLELLVKNPKKIYSRDDLLRIVWGDEYFGDTRTVDVHIRRLREKIEDNPSEPRFVHTQWGVGYFYSEAVK